MAGIHELTDVSADDEGGWWTACKCDWSSGPHDDREEAADAYREHRKDVQG